MTKPPKHDNAFEKIKLVNKEILISSFNKITPIEGDRDPKKRLLHDISTAISYSEKASLLNHTVVKARIIKKEIMVGDKVSKLLKTNKNTTHTKTNVKNQFDVALYAREQTTALLKKIKKRIEKDKSDPLDFNALNADIKALYEHYQDKVILRDASLTNKAYAKSMTKISAKQKKIIDATQKVSVNNNSHDNDAIQVLEKEKQDKQRSLDDSAKDIEKYKAKVLQWNQKHPKPKSNYTKLMDFVTEPLLHTSKSEQIVKSIRKNSDIAPSDKLSPGSTTGKSKGKATGMSL